MVNQKTEHQNEFALHTIGRVHSCFPEKFGIPRQAGLVPSTASIEILSPYDRDEAFRGLESISHIWVLFIFHEAMREQWHPTVRPPRLGGNERLGVFATRSNFRPNPIGLSLVELTQIERREGILRLDVRGGDLLDNTPVIDIKPYLPYADFVEKASAGIANQAPVTLPVTFSETAQQQLDSLNVQDYPNVTELIISSLGQDPRPAYKANDDDDRIYGCRYFDLNVRWQNLGDVIHVISVDRYSSS
jgi:tRNA-Thr(GGU) m(6)t(6)A37 methyltransferase TsaA